ncbi:MAG: ABC1 kinase family protein [Saccharofermentanales bacterium]
MRGNRRLHWRRYRQIIGVLVSNGFGLLLEQLGIFGYLRLRHRKLDSGSIEAAANARLSVGERLRLSCEQLGPTFVKIGQILSTRPDIFSPEIAGELEKLQDSANPFPFADVRQVIESEFGQPMEEVFAWIDPEPIAAASLSQVHRAGLPTGQTVVVKVQRPGIKAGIETDLSILKDLVGFVVNRTSYGDLYDFAGMMAQLERTLMNELDFRKEGANADRFRRNFSARPSKNQAQGVAVPVIRWIYTTDRVLTMDCVDGIRINRIDELEEAGIDRSELAIRLCQDIVFQVLEDGFFHADPHPGNLLVGKDGRLFFLDLGMVGELSEKKKRVLSNLFIGIANKNSRRVTEAIVDLDTLKKRVGLRKFEREIDHLLDTYLSIPISEIQLGPLIAEIFQLAYRHKIQIPGEMTLIAKVLITLQGITEKLDPEVNLLVIMRPLATRLVRRGFSLEELGYDLQRGIGDLKALLQQAPPVLLGFLHKLEEDDYSIQFDLKDIDKVQKHFDRISNRLSFSIVLLAVSLIVAGIIVGSSLAAGNEPSLLRLNTIVLRASLVVAAAIIVALIISIFRTKKF